MTNNPNPPSARAVFKVADVRAVDQAAIANGIAGKLLMSRAAEFALAVALREFPDARRWQVLCGAGNNAGDGYLLAALAQKHGIHVDVLFVADPQSLQGDASNAWQHALDSSVPIAAFRGTIAADADLLIDSLLGNGLTRDVDGDYAVAVAAINQHRAPCLAIDIPTGINGDSGAVMGVAVKATRTCTFVGRKAGLYLAAGPDHCGQIDFTSLDIPGHCYANAKPLANIIDDDILSAALARRERQAHKGSFGHVLLIGGGPGMPGAARLAGEAALRSGAGRVTVATHTQNIAAITAARPELMCFTVETAADLAPLLNAATVVAIGPGLGTDNWARALVNAVNIASLPLVVDADALNLLAAAPGKNADRVITPHPGEAGRLLECNSVDIQGDRLQAVTELQTRYGGVAVLKGQGTLVSTGDGPPWLCTEGNPGMAAPGMGDVLTGVIAGLIAQGLTIANAALVGVLVHARAGDRAALTGERGLLASELLAELRACVNP